MRPLVVVRPEPGASATVAAAQALGLTAIALPLFAVEALEWDAPDPDRFDALLLTSANAVRSAEERLQRYQRLPAYCVGAATADAARNAGLTVASVGGGGVNALLRCVPDSLRLLHLCGADRREPTEAAQPIVAIPVYRSIELPIPTDFAQIEGAVVALHSPRAACALATRADETRLDRGTAAVVAISAEAAAAAGDGWSEVEIAPVPTDLALLAIAVRLCNKSS